MAHHDLKEIAMLIEDTLDKFKVPAREKGELIAFVGSVKRDIVEKP